MKSTHTTVTSMSLECSTQVGIGAIVVPTAKNIASKDNPKDILRNKNHLYRIVLVHLTYIEYCV